MTCPTPTVSSLRSAGFRCVCVLLLSAPGSFCSAQQPGRDIGPALATRQELRDALARLERGGPAQPEAALIRSRLDSGDFQTGDRILIRVEGEQQLSDTFTVGAGPALGLPQIGAVPLGGLLRSELSGRLQGYLARYLRDPVFQVRPLIRILVEGEVARPGFYAVAPDLPLADAITAAGGLTQRAKAGDMRVERGGARIWAGEVLREALGRGYSVDQLNLRAGDRLFVPARGEGGRTLQILGLLLTIPVAVFTITRLH